MTNDNDIKTIPLRSVTTIPDIEGFEIAEARLVHDGYYGWLELALEGYGTIAIKASDSSDDAQPVFSTIEGARVSVQALDEDDAEEAPHGA